MLVFRTSIGRNAISVHFHERSSRFVKLGIRAPSIFVVVSRSKENGKDNFLRVGPHEPIVLSEDDAMDNVECLFFPRGDQLGDLFGSTLILDDKYGRFCLAEAGLRGF
ncbi:hypothetical protein KM043_016140 [Ampulex compressa]|nr:hypothetical protein KM043_016140 [Ampulex compressa]